MDPAVRATPTWEPSFEEIFDLSLDLLCIAGFDGYFKRVNPTFVEAFGYSREELMSRPFLEFVHPDDRARSRDAFEKLERGEEVIRFENKNLSADGSILWLEWSSRPVLGEGVLYGTARDVTDRKRAEERLRQAQETVEASRDELRMHVEEQAALRRVATLVARGGPATEVLDAVCEEVDRLLDADSTRMLRYEDDGSATVLATHGEIGLHTPAGTSLTLEGEATAAAKVLSTGRPARLELYEGASGSMAALVSTLGFRSGVAAPISVDGRLWGVMAAGWKRREPPLADAETRMAEFTELVATAIANAENRAELSLLADDQAALRRVATLVARGVSPTEILDAVAAEVGRLLGADWAAVHRSEPDGTVTVLAARGDSGLDIPVGGRATLDDESVVGSVLRAGRPVRMESYHDAPGSWAARARELGVRSVVGAPIIVEGRPWGVMMAAWTRQEPLPADDVEGRMAGFTELVGTAIANAESRTELRVRVDEQVALRRVATLVARGVSPTEVLDAVAAEVGRLLGADLAMLQRYEPDGVATVLASRGAAALRAPVGTRISLEETTVVALVARTGRPARMEDYEDIPGPWAALAREMGVRAGVGTPITVEGRLWGVMIAAWTRQEPLSADDAEARMANFTELAGTAIANADSRAELRVHVEEQEALRRVATLVARGVSPAALLDAVAVEVGRLLDADWAGMMRYEGDNAATILALYGEGGREALVGRRLSLEGESVARSVRQTGRPARRRGYMKASGEWAAQVRDLGVGSAVGAPITVEGRLWGVMIAAWTQQEQLPVEEVEARMAEFTELIGTAIANAESQAKLAASRARVVAATAEERQRVVRDLHDGAQQRLVHAVINLKLGIRELERGDKHTQEFLMEALDHAEQANSELRELAHGILPGVLTSGGLRAAVNELANRSALPVTVDVFEERLPSALEATSYFVVSEALTNVVKHSRATRAEVRARVEERLLRVEVRDEGAGGADPGEGSGLTGLRDRVEGLGGTIEIASPPGSGTSVLVEIPLESGSA